jgi:hypothetical protein
MVVALFDLIPVIGSTVGGAVVTLIALTVSLPAGPPERGRCGSSRQTSGAVR